MNAKVAERARVISALKKVYPNLSQREVAERLGVSERIISYTLRRTGTLWVRGRYHRHRSFPNVERDAAIVADALATVRSLAAIGQDYGMTRERVRQIIAKAGIKKQHARQRDEEHYRCIVCGKPHKTFRRGGRCRACHMAATPRITQPCGNCGTPVTRTVAVARQHMKSTGKDSTTFFCNRPCRGQWFGRKYGVQRGERWRGRGRKKNGATP